jgi:HEAT repeat protein
VREGLRIVAQRLAGASRLLGVKPQVVRVAEHALEDRAGIFQVAAVGAAGVPERLDQPEGAHVEGALVPRQTVGELLGGVPVHAASKDASLLGPICGLLPTTDPALAEALATALGQLGDTRVEDELLRLMSRDSIRVKRSAAAALGNVGTARAVEPLLLITSFPETARNAIRRIQARLEDAEAGRLSVAAQEPPVGGLSVALEEGALSVASGGPPDVPNGNLQSVPAGRGPVEE